MPAFIPAHVKHQRVASRLGCEVPMELCIAEALAVRHMHVTDAARTRAVNALSPRRNPVHVARVTVPAKYSYRDTPLHATLLHWSRFLTPTSPTAALLLLFLRAGLASSVCIGASLRLLLGGRGRRESVIQEEHLHCLSDAYDSSTLSSCNIGPPPPHECSLLPCTPDQGFGRGRQLCQCNAIHLHEYVTHRYVHARLGERPTAHTVPPISADDVRATVSRSSSIPDEIRAEAAREHLWCWARSLVPCVLAHVRLA